MSYREVMDMPVTAFWSMNKNIVRVSAERDMRQLTLANVAQSGEAVQEYRERLVKEMGDVVKINPLAAEPDAEGIEFLKSIYGG